MDTPLRRGAPDFSATPGPAGPGLRPNPGPLPARKGLILNYLTPHSKWAIHTTYHDTLTMLTLFRGGGTLWLNDEDAESVEIKDNDWVEIFNLNGIMMARAVVSHRIPCGKNFLYHTYERTMNVPLAQITRKKKRDAQQSHAHLRETLPT